jgi:dTDP-4-amino-4,6-dideoxygalactose transaminase
MINVTKSFLPPLAEYENRLKRVWESEWVTNRGALVLELEAKLRERLAVNHLLFVNNGTVAIQIAIKALDITGEIITTPFSYVATTSSIVWENCKPVFADIDPERLTIDPKKIEAVITPNTQAILATHVYGYPCDVDAIDAIAKKYNLAVIYDAAHCFGVKFRGKSLFAYGTVSTSSFHATKLFHTGEGGAIVCNDARYTDKVFWMHNFGHNGQEAFWGVGINGKSSELHAAMGLAVLPHVDDIITSRRQASDHYDALLRGTSLLRPKVVDHLEYNYAYYPVLFPNEAALLRARDAMNREEIFPRRYFYPALSHLPYVTSAPTPVADDVAPRALCLPLYHKIALADVERVATIIKANL